MSNNEAGEGRGRIFNIQLSWDLDGNNIKMKRLNSWRCFSASMARHCLTVLDQYVHARRCTHLISAKISMPIHTHIGYSYQSAQGYKGPL